MNQLLVKPPIGLYEKIIKRIHKKERFLILRKIILVSTTLVISLIGFLPSFNMLSFDFTKSGFFNFFSLIFSDFSTVTTYWQSFAMTILQTLPAISLAIFLAVLLTFLQSIKFLIKYERRYFAI